MTFRSLRGLPVHALFPLALVLALSFSVAAAPAVPAHPAKPSRPAQPAKPGKPAKPMNPAKPGKPAGPATPGKPAKPSRTPRPVKPLPNPAKPPQPVAASAESPLPDAVVALTPEQHAVASRVLVGQVACEFGQMVELEPLQQQPGHFMLRLGKASYRLAPQPTTTGAVRLEDAQGAVVWLQIPTKSMLLDARLGQRLVDNCQHADQRSVLVVAGSSLGIADVPPLSDPWAGSARSLPLLELAFEPLPLLAASSCCSAEALSPPIAAAAVAGTATAGGSCAAAQDVSAAIVKEAAPTAPARTGALGACAPAP